MINLNVQIGEKPYHCDICFRDFGYNHVLKLHRVQHYGAKCYKCTICDETFKSKKEMEAHIKGHANDIPDDENADDMSNQMQHHQQQQQQEVKPSILLNTPTASSASTTPSPNGIVLNHQIVTKYETNENSNQMISFAEQFSLLNSTTPAPSTTITTVVYPETPKDSEASSEQNSDGDDVTYMNMYTRFEQSVANSYGTNNSALLASSATLQPITPTSNSSNNGNICNNSNNLITLKPIQQSPPSASQLIYESNQMNLNRNNGYFGGSTSASQQANNDYK